MKLTDLAIAVDPVTGDTSFKLNDAPYTLRFDFEALAGFYKLAGVNPILEPLGADPMRVLQLLHAGLRFHHPSLTVDQVKAWFTSAPMFAALSGLLSSGLRSQTPDPDPSAPAEPQDPPTA